FELLKQLPDPIPGNDLHYKSFEELYGTTTTEEHRPSLKNSKPITSKT
ncbi:40035_t:CDS:1, partial [Gigaspora margarita]